ncbi:MAG: zinc-binding dehydrogenase [Chloroflexota bacterium]|nr:zinc-binding dehydrogenase [Chloroflexota bacterium]
MRLLEMTGNANSRVIDAAPPEPKSDEVLIETARSAICGSEMKTYRGPGRADGNVGHEAVGRVIALGEGVAGLQIGDRIGASAVVGCGGCGECKSGRYTWCRSTASRSNMHAEQFVIPARACSPLPDDLPWDEAALLTGDGMGVPWHTAKKIDRADIETIVVMGLGPIGLGNVLMQAHLGRRVIGVDIIDYRVDFATRLGADVSLKANDSLIERILDLTGGEGADVVIDCAGQRGSVENSFRAVRRGGIVVFNGESMEEMLAPSRDFNRREIWAVGCWYYFMSEVPEMFALWREGLDVARLITHRFPLADAPEAFALFAKGQTGKVLLRP